MSSSTLLNPTKKPFYYSLTFQLVAGLVMGGITGLLWPDFGVQLNPLAKGFVSLIKMVAGLIVCLTVISGFAQMKEGSGVGRTGLIAVVYFEIVSTIALLTGLVLGNIFEPGKGLHIHADASAAVGTPHAASGTADFILSIIPKTVVDALASGIMLQVLLVSLLFGYALFALGEKAKPVVDFVNVLSDATFKVVGVILKLAPIGVFGAAAFMLGKYGLHALMPLLKLVGLAYLGGLFMVLVIFIKHIREELIIGFTTCSSEAVLPGLMKKLEQAGCQRTTVGFVVPAGYSLNLDGASIYMTLAALFIAQAGGLDLNFGEQASLLFVFLLTSKGVAGITGGSFVTLSATLLMFPDIPLEGLAFILGVDRLMDTMRTTVNVLGNGVATMAISWWRKERADAVSAPLALRD